MTRRGLLYCIRISGLVTPRAALAILLGLLAVGLLLFQLDRALGFSPAAKRAQLEEQDKLARAQLQLRFNGPRLAALLARWSAVTEGGLGNRIPPVEECFQQKQLFCREYQELGTADPFGNPFQLTAEGSGVRITSFGADGEIGGEGVNADLSFFSPLH